MSGGQPSSGDRPTGWTPERSALFFAEYPSVSNPRELLERINALPGRRVSMRSLRQKAYLHKVRRLTQSTKVKRGPPGRDPIPLVAGVELLDPVVASTETIAAWARANGVAERRATLRHINAARTLLGLPPFIRAQVLEAA